MTAFLEGRTKQVAFEEVPPLDIFGTASLAGEPELPHDSVPQVIANYAWDRADRIGVVPAMVAMPCLAVGAGAISDLYKVQPKKHDSDWQESAILWIAGYAGIGENKTASLDAALEPAKEIEKELWQEYSKARRDYDYQLDLYRASRKSKNPRKKPDPPPQPRFLTDDTTIEALAGILKDNPQGVLNYRDELAGWWASFDAYRTSDSKGKDRAAWLELNNGGPKLIDRVGRREYVPNWSVCLFGYVQPENMVMHMGKLTNDGLCQRFIPFFGRRIGDGADRKPDQVATEKYFETIKRLVRKQPKHNSIFYLTSEAQFYRQFVSDTTKAVMHLPDTSTAFKAHLNKWSGIFARLLLTYHMIDTVAQSVTESSDDWYISGETAARVAKLMIDFLLPNAARFYSELFSQGDHLTHSRWIAGYILSRELKEITARDIYRAYREFRSESAGVDWEGINRAMNGLTVAGWAKPMSDKKRGYYTKWKINSSIHSTFAEKARAERERREEEKQKIQEAVQFLNLQQRTDNHEPV